jgi:hypothetical protein
MVKDDYPLGGLSIILIYKEHWLATIRYKLPAIPATFLHMIAIVKLRG